MTPPIITGLILTYNGERLLKHCLHSLNFCNRILVIDSFSADATVSIAQQSGATVVQRVWEGPGPQFHYAFHLLDTEFPTDWVVSLDQDEICTIELQRFLLEAIHRADVTKDASSPIGFWMSRRSWYYDRFLLHSGWYPDRLLRCFRHGHMDVSVSGAHYSFHPKGATLSIQGDILHYPYENFHQHLEKINAYAQQGAEALAAKGVRGGIMQGILHGVGRFARIYLLKRGFLDGRAGFINAVHGAFYAFLKYVRIREGQWGFPYAVDEPAKNIKD